MRVTDTNAWRAGRLLAGAAYMLSVLLGTTLLWVTLWIAAPTIGLGWDPVVLDGDSMAPVLRTGDVVLTASPQDEPYAPGTVITYDDPAVEGRVTTHRIRSVTDDGRYLTKGDGNRTADSTPVPTENVRGSGRVLVPKVGLPLVWWQRGQFVYLAALMAVLTTGYAYSSRYALGLSTPHRGGRGAEAEQSTVENEDRGVETRQVETRQRGAGGRQRRLEALDETVAWVASVRPASLRDDPGVEVAAETRTRSRHVHQRGLAAMLVLGLLLAGVVTGHGSSQAGFTDTAEGAADFSAASSFGVALGYVKTVGSSSCGATGTSVLVPASGVASGNTLVLRVHTQADTNPIGVSDSRGNSYRQDASGALSGKGRIVVFSAYITTALQDGDTIDVSWSLDKSASVAVEEFQGIPETDYLDVSGSGGDKSATPSATVTTSGADRVLYGALWNRNSVTFVEDPDGWTSLPTVATSGCEAAENRGAYQIVSTTGTYTWSPTFASGGEEWAETLVAYTGGG